MRRVGECKRREHVHELTKNNPGVKLRGQEMIASGFGKRRDSSNRLPPDSPERIFSARLFLSNPLPLPVLNIARNFTHSFLGSVGVIRSWLLGQFQQQA